MAEARLGDSKLRFPKNQGESSAEAPRWQYPKRPDRGTGTLLTLAEIEERFGVREYWIYQWAHEGKLHVVPVGKRFKYADWEIEALAATLKYLRVA